MTIFLILAPYGAFAALMLVTSAAVSLFTGAAICLAVIVFDMVGGRSLKILGTGSVVVFAVVVVGVDVVEVLVVVMVVVVVVVSARRESDKKQIPATLIIEFSKMRHNKHRDWPDDLGICFTTLWIEKTKAKAPFKKKATLGLMNGLSLG